MNRPPIMMKSYVGAMVIKLVDVVVLRMFTGKVVSSYISLKHTPNQAQIARFQIPNAHHGT
jgi:hypothetical protein